MHASFSCESLERVKTIWIPHRNSVHQYQWTTLFGERGNYIEWLLTHADYKWNWSFIINYSSTDTSAAFPLHANILDILTCLVFACAIFSVSKIIQQMYISISFKKNYLFQLPLSSYNLMIILPLCCQLILNNTILTQIFNGPHIVRIMCTHARNLLCSHVHRNRDTVEQGIYSTYSLQFETPGIKKTGTGKGSGERFQQQKQWFVFNQQNKNWVVFTGNINTCGSTVQYISIPK